MAAFSHGPSKRPDVAAKKAARQQVSSSTVELTLNQFCKPFAKSIPFHKLVKVLSQVALEAKIRSRSDRQPREDLEVIDMHTCFTAQAEGSLAQAHCCLHLKHTEHVRHVWHEFQQRQTTTVIFTHNPSLPLPF